MKYALIGKSIAHSRSPKLYKEIISPNITYDLIDVPNVENLPQLVELAKIYKGINITSPYKRNYVSSVVIERPEVKELGAINTISFTDKGWFGTNTDMVAVETILKRFLKEYSTLHLMILGSGVMGTLTSLVAKKLNIDHFTLDRKNGLAANIDLRNFHKPNIQNVVINACSRDFVFSGEINDASLFWDYNYNFIPHQNTLPLKVKTYLDGQEMLLIQAQDGQILVTLTNIKLKC